MQRSLSHYPQSGSREHTDVIAATYVGTGHQSKAPLTLETPQSTRRREPYWIQRVNEVSLR